MAQNSGISMEEAEKIVREHHILRSDEGESGSEAEGTANLCNNIHIV